MGDFSAFKAIRKTYADLLPGWMAEYEATGEMRQDPYFMDWKFTPIENHVWGDIRQAGIPFYPQVPVLNYFLDFGCPFLKIGIECDGKAWHDHDLDKARDARLAKAGWMIFRIEGHECCRVVEPWPEYEDEDRSELTSKYFLETSEGVVQAIKRRYFDEDLGDRHAFLIDQTLFEHRSTPETNPKRQALATPGYPVHIGATLERHMRLIMDRMRKAS